MTSRCKLIFLSDAPCNYPKKLTEIKLETKNCLIEFIGFLGLSDLLTFVFLKELDHTSRFDCFYLYEPI